MNYILKVNEDGSKAWQQIVVNRNTDEISYKEVSGPIVLDAENFYAGDQITVNTNPPPDPKNCIPFEEMLKQMEEEAKKRPIKKFEPCVFYSTISPGQAIEVYLESDAHTGRWINNHLTVYESCQDRRIIGFRVDGLVYLKAKHES